MEPPDILPEYQLSSEEIEAQTIEIIKGEKKDTLWLIVKCRFRWSIACPFKLETEENSEGELNL